MPKDITSLLADLEEEEALAVTRTRLEAGDDPLTIMEECRKGMEIVGERFASGEYFLPDLIFSGEILKEISELVKPELSKMPRTDKSGKIVLGTVAGDIHDIGLNIVAFMLDVNGFEVYNLGIDVPAEKFVEKMKETKATILGLSGFLTLAFDSMKETIQALEASGLRDQVKIMIGGGQVDDMVREYTTADAYGKDAMAAVTLAKGWLQEVGN